MTWRILALSLLVFGLLTVSQGAQTNPEDARVGSLPPDATLNPRSPGGLLPQEKKPATGGGAQLIVYFVVLVALAGGGIYVMKRGWPMRGVRLGENRLQVLETKMLGNRQFLVVVKYEDSKMLLGVGPGQIQLLCPLDSADDDLEELTRKTAAPAFETKPV